MLGLVSIGLLLSLLPRTSFVAQTSSEVVDAVGPVWPDQSVEQVLDSDVRVVSEVRVWAASEPRHGPAEVVAALLQGPERELVRQAPVTIRPSTLLRPYVIEFAPYEAPRGEPLILQLWVSTERGGPVTFGTSARDGERDGPAINRNPTDLGPLALAFIWRGDGWRAALSGSPIDALRLGSGIAAAFLAVLLRPRISRAVRQNLRPGYAVATTALTAIRTVIQQPSGPVRASRKQDPPIGESRTLYWFPWLIPLFAILHYLHNNLHLMRAYEAVFPSVAIMAVVTAAYLIFKVALKGDAPASLYTGLLATIFFAYGHVSHAASKQPDIRFLLGVGVPMLLAIALFLRGRSSFVRPIAKACHMGSLILILFPILQILIVLVPTQLQSNGHSVILSDFDDVEQVAQSEAAPIATDDLRDIYFIALDGYPRNGSPPSFDNSKFVRALEERGFYVDPHARSNYSCTDWSIPSSLNLSYIKGDDTCRASVADTYRIYRATVDHALGRLLTRLGYEYVHVSSGWRMTKTSQNASQVVDFTPQGRVESEYLEYEEATQYQYAWQRAFSLSNQFTNEFAKTTLITAFLTLDPIESEDRFAYGWSDPRRALDWVEYMKEVRALDSPKFVFAHLVKPHQPFSFDQHGNIAFGEGWSDDHDPSVASAFHGQVIWLNARMLEVVDSILDVEDNKPIIVIMSDHGREDCRYLEICHEILAAYLLPDGGETAIYPTITSVNVFRAILSRYFGIELGLLEDRVFVSAG